MSYLFSGDVLRCPAVHHVPITSLNVLCFDVQQVHNLRQRARDREKRLRSQLSFVKTQLKEALEALASAEEVACVARRQKVEHKEESAAALARWKERDRHAHKLEARLAEVKFERMNRVNYFSTQQSRVPST